MTMNPAQMVELYGTQAVGFASGAHADPQAISSLALNEAYRARLAQGLICWRHGLGEPGQHFDQALAIAREGVSSAGRLVPRIPLWQVFDVTHAIYVSYLTEQQVEDVSKAACAFGDWKKKSLLYSGQAFNVAVLGVLRGGRPPEAWQAAVTELAGRRRTRLFAETYQNYMDLVAAGHDRRLDDVRRAALRAAELYEKRSRDALFNDGQIEGGGPGNPHVVDFRAAAIIRALVPELEAELECQGFVHVWRWGRPG